MKFNQILYAPDGAEGSGASGEAAQNADFSNVVFGTQEAGQAAPADNQSAETGGKSEPTFKELIKGKYKDDFQAEMQQIFDKRFKQAKTTEESMAKMQPVFSALSAKYGVDENDLDGILRAVESDDDYYEDAAYDMGLTPQQYKEYVQKNQQLKAYEEQAKELQRRQNAQALYQKWEEEAIPLKQDYPNFDLRKECENPSFTKLLNEGLPMRDAYNALHLHEILPQSMQYAVDHTLKAHMDTVRANGIMPDANGSGNGSQIRVTDVNSLTGKQIDEILRRVANGEKITFG